MHRKYQQTSTDAKSTAKLARVTKNSCHHVTSKYVGVKPSNWLFYRIFSQSI